MMWDLSLLPMGKAAINYKKAMHFDLTKNYGICKHLPRGAIHPSPGDFSASSKIPEL